MILNIIVAMANNRVIGNANSIPWHLPEDLQNFRRLTLGHAVLMGRKTWESLPEKFRPLPERLNVVLSREINFIAKGAIVVDSFSSAFKQIAKFTQVNSQNNNCEITTTVKSENLINSVTQLPIEIFVIGGENVYRQALPLCRNIYLTAIDFSVNGDSFFPEIAENQWKIITTEQHISGSGINFQYIHYQRLDA